MPTWLCGWQGDARYPLGRRLVAGAGSTAVALETFLSTTTALWFWAHRLLPLECAHLGGNGVLPVAEPLVPLMLPLALDAPALKPHSWEEGEPRVCKQRLSCPAAKGKVPTAVSTTPAVSSCLLAVLGEDWACTRSSRASEAKKKKLFFCLFALVKRKEGASF